MSYFKMMSKWLLLIAIVIGFGGAIHFHLYQSIGYTSLMKYHQIWVDLAQQHYFFMVFIYMLVYIFAIALSVPGAIFFTLAGGFLFGPIAALYVVVSATMGSTILFLAVRTALGEWLANKAGSWVTRMEKGFQENAFYYLLSLRLMPVFPFWIINIVAALLNVRLRTFILATFLGIIPGTFVYVVVGHEFNTLFASQQTPILKNIVTPSILFSLLGLTVLSILPVVYKRWKAYLF